MDSTRSRFLVCTFVAGALAHAGCHPPAGKSGPRDAAPAPGSDGAPMMSSDGGGSGGGGGTGGGGGGGSGGDGGITGAIDLCAGLVTNDLTARPMTTLARPALGKTVVDAEFGTTIRRITDVATASGSGTAAYVPMYTTISAWNADESLLILYSVKAGGHVLHDGRTYAPIGPLDINPSDLEQVWWHTSDPDVFFYVDGQQLIRYHVKAAQKEMLTSFAGICGSQSVTNGSDPMFMSWDSNRIGLACGSLMFVYDIAQKAVIAKRTQSTGTLPAQVAPSGRLAYLEADTGDVLDVTDPGFKTLRALTLQAPDNHASLGRLANGHDTWNGTVYDDGNDDAKSNVGNLVTWDLTDGTGGAIIGPKTGYPYPPDGHVSALAYKQPGWIFVSTYGHTDGSGLLDLENLVADTNTGRVCRVGRHRSWGKANTAVPGCNTGNGCYWAEAHTIPSPSGTRAVFASDWGNGATIDTYVLELPSYTR